MAHTDRNKKDTTSRGDLTEFEVATALMRAGRKVLRPLSSGLRYDLVIDNEDGTFARVQCKTGVMRDGSVQFRLYMADGRRPHGVPYHGEVEAFGVFCPANRRAYLVPISVIAASSPPSSPSSSWRSRSLFRRSVSAYAGSRFGSRAGVDDPTAAAIAPPYPEETFAILRDLVVEPKVVLDVGCGDGALARPLGRFVERIDALDPSAEMLAAGRQIAGEDAPIRWILGRAEDAPLDGSYGFEGAREPASRAGLVRLSPRARMSGVCSLSEKHGIVVRL